LIGITIEEADVDFVDTEVHKGKLESIVLEFSCTAISKKHTSCSFFPTPIINNFPPNCSDC
jgi:hypothetical protein